MIYIPKYVELVIEKLEVSGFEAFIVGGSLRDTILGKEPNDFDITTNATPDEIEEVFSDYKTVNIGKKFGTIVVIQDEGNIEITTYRTEGEYIDGRRPSEVFYSNNILDDLSRRDFTINSMAYNKKTGIIDPFNGREDLDKRILRTVGNPIERFREDHLRILRAIRFATQLEFEIEKETYLAIIKESYSLENISMERIFVEFTKILLSNTPSSGIRLLLDSGILSVIIPELLETVDFNQQTPHHDKDVFEHSICVLDRVSPILELRLAALFHDIGKPNSFTLDDENIGHFYGHDKLGVEITKDILIRLKASNELINSVCLLINDHMSRHNDMKDRGLKRQIARVGSDNIFKLLELQKADRICSSDKDNDIEFLLEREKEIRSILEYQEPYEKSQLLIDGNDIINLGYKQGKKIGQILDYLMEQVIEDPELNEIHTLKDIVMERFEK